MEKASVCCFSMIDQGLFDGHKGRGSDLSSKMRGGRKKFRLTKCWEKARL